MIEERRIAIDGKPVEKPATLLTSLHGVTVDGQPVKAPAPARLFRFHKPAGLLTAASDPKGRPTIYDRLPRDLPRVMPVGRLDMNTEGLLLLTTDGGLKRQLELPASGVERTYRARTFGPISQDQLEELIHGIEIEGIRYGSIDANLERRTGRNQWIEMRLREGKNREVRRVLEHLGLQVSRLIRTAYGPFQLDDLPAGAVDEIRQHDLVAFKQALSGSPPRSREERPAEPRPARRERPTERRPAREERSAERRPARGERPSERRPAREERPAERRPARGERPAERRPARGERPTERRPAREERPAERRPPREESLKERRPAREERPAERRPVGGRPSRTQRPGTRPSSPSPKGRR